jgi:hypothetical protein
MLIPTWVWWALMIVTALAGVLGIGMVKVGGMNGTRRERIVTIAMLACLGLCLALYFFHRKVIVCTERGGSVHAERQIEVGASGDGTLVVNHTSQTLQLVTYFYGALSMGPSDPKPVPPGASVATDDDITNIGPGHQPPGSVMSSMKFDSRTWLTW